MTKKDDFPCKIKRKGYKYCYCGCYKYLKKLGSGFHIFRKDRPKFQGCNCYKNS